MRTPAAWLAIVAAVTTTWAIAGCDVIFGLTRSEVIQPGTGGGATMASSSATTSGSGGAGTGGGCAGGSGGSTPLVCDAQTVCWDRLWGSSGTLKPLAVAVDPAGENYVVGQVSGMVQLDCAHVITGDSAGDAFVLALTPNGTVSWVQTLSGTLAQTATAIAVDAMGNVIVGGYTQAAASAGKPPMPLSVSPGLFVVQFKNDGTPVWITALGGSDGSSVDDVTTEANGNIDLSGRFLGTINVGSGPSMASGTPIAWTGTLQSADGLPLGGGAWNNAGGTVLAVRSRYDAAGYKYTAGSFQGTISAGLGQGPLTASGNTDIFYARYYNVPPAKVASQGQIGGTGDKMLTAFAVSGSGDMLIGGQFTGTFTWFGTTLMAPASGTGAFALMNSSNGWAYTLGDGPGEVHVGMDQAGNVVLAGAFVGTLTLAGQTASTPGMSQNIFAAKLSPNAADSAKWLHSFPDAMASSAHGVAVTPFGDSVVVGEVSGAFSFVDGGAQMAAGVEGFALRLGQ